jgi:hypothetical protein
MSGGAVLHAYCEKVDNIYKGGPDEGRQLASNLRELHACQRSDGRRKSTCQPVNVYFRGHLTTSCQSAAGPKPVIRRRSSELLALARGDLNQWERYG